MVEWSGDYMLDVNVFRQETDTVSILEEKNINGLVQVNIYKDNIFVLRLVSNSVIA